MSSSRFGALRCLAAAAALAGAAGSAPAAVLESLDLASLLDEADLVVLVDGFETAGMTLPGTGIVRKVYRGEHATAAPILITPWAIDLRKGVGFPGGAAPAAVTAVFFLKAQPGGGSWGAVSSGVRVILNDEVFGVMQAGSGPYVLVRARRESLDPRRAGKPLDLAGLEQEIVEAKERLRLIEEALAARTDRDSPRRWEELIEGEARRLFPDGPSGGSIQRSELVLKLAAKLAQAGEIDVLWRFRGRFPRERMGAEIDALIADRMTYAFIDERLREPGSRMEVIELCAEQGFRMPNEIKRDLVERILDVTPELPDRSRARGYAGASALYRGTEIDAADPLLPRIIQTLKRGDAGALYHIGSALAERQPELAHSVLQDSLRLFALVTIDEASIRRVAGRVDLRRFPADHALVGPVVVLERVQPDGSVPDRRREPLAAPPDMILPRKAGTTSAAFRASWKEPLPAGTWRAFLELKVEGAGGSREWRSGASEFRVEP